MLLGTLIQNDFLYIHWYASGEDFQKSHQLTMKYYEMISDEIDRLAEIAVELGLLLPNPSMAIEVIEGYTPQSESGYIYSEVLKVCSKLINMYLTNLRIAREDINDTSIQSVLDELIRYWSKTVNYTIHRQTVLPTQLNGFIQSNYDEYLASSIIDTIN